MKNDIKVIKKYLLWYLRKHINEILSLSIYNMHFLLKIGQILSWVTLQYSQNKKRTLPVCMLVKVQISKTIEIKIVFLYFSLTLYSMITPFDAFEILCIGKYYGKWSFVANARFSIIISKVFKTLLKFFLIFISMLSKNRK